MYEVYDKRQQIRTDTWGNTQKKIRQCWSLRLIGVRAHSHHNCCQLFAKIYGPKEKVCEEGVKEG